VAVPPPVPPRAKVLTVRYDVRASGPDGSESRFVHEQDEELKVGASIRPFTMSYLVERIVPSALDDDEFDAVVYAKWAMGPAQADFNP
jgi:hypothetical protein